MKSRPANLLAWTTITVLALPVFYYLSLGPVGWLVAHGVLPNEPFQSIYRELVVEDICGASRYYDWWVRPKPFFCGGTGGEVSPPSQGSTTNQDK